MRLQIAAPISLGENNYSFGIEKLNMNTSLIHQSKNSKHSLYAKSKRTHI